MSFAYRFERPRLRAGVQRRIGRSHALLSLEGDDCRLEFPKHLAGTVSRLIEDLYAGVPRTEYVDRFPGLQEEIEHVIDELDAVGMLFDDVTQSKDGGLDGRQLFVECKGIIKSAGRKCGAGRFYAKLTTGQATRAQIIGYALEYFQIVHRAPSLIAPVLAHAVDRQSRTMLLEFFRSELHHDRLMARGLERLGYSFEDLCERNPMPETYAVCTFLNTLAVQNMVAFFAALLVFEDSAHEFLRAYSRAATRLGLPAMLGSSFLRHASINASEGHDDLPRELLSRIPLISPEEVIEIKKQLILLIELLVRMERGVLSRYRTRVVSH